MENTIFKDKVLRRAVFPCSAYYYYNKKILLMVLLAMSGYVDDRKTQLLLMLLLPMQMIEKRSKMQKNTDTADVTSAYVDDYF